MFVADSKQMKKIDLSAVTKYGIPEIVLMENAANAVLKHIEALNLKKVLIICGGGNNGGDGFALARLMHSKGYIVKVYCFSSYDKMSQASVINYEILKKIGIDIGENIEGLTRDILIYDLIIDAIFGTGLKGNVRGIYKDIINMVNESGKYIVSIDIPSGIDSDSGEKLGCCIYARETITFCCYKFGHLLNEGRQASGKICVENISIPMEVIAQHQIKTFTCSDDYPANLLKKRLTDTNKGNCGRVYIIGGSYEMSGAVALAAKAALRSGAGLVTCVVPNAIINRVGSLVPETTFLSCGSNNGKIDLPYEKLDQVMSRADVIAVGPGMGIDEKNIRALEYILNRWDKPLVLDADALNMLCNIKQCLKTTSAKVMLTPHPGEMSRLTGLGTDEVNNRRLHVAREFASEYNCTVLLKGASTIVSNGEDTYINTTGNPGMASGGSGDVLTGIVAAIAAQGYNIFGACVLGSFIHGVSGDEAYKVFGNGLTASDLIEFLGKSLKQ